MSNIEKVSKDMNEFMENALDAEIARSMYGSVGREDFKVEDYPIKFRKYLDAYVNTDKDVCECFTMYLDDNGLLT